MHGNTAGVQADGVLSHSLSADAGSGVYVENTIEAMQALIQRDNGPEGPVPDLHYVEIDVQASARLTQVIAKAAAAAPVPGYAELLL